MKGKKTSSKGKAYRNPSKHRGMYGNGKMAKGGGKASSYKGK